MFHADTLFDNEESFGLPEIEERDLSASLTLRWSRKRKRWECRNAFFWQDAKMFYIRGQVVPARYPNL